MKKNHPQFEQRAELTEKCDDFIIIAKSSNMQSNIQIAFSAEHLSELEESVSVDMP